MYYETITQSLKYTLKIIEFNIYGSITSDMGSSINETSIGERLN